MTKSEFIKAYQEICHELWWVYPIFCVTQIKKKTCCQMVIPWYHIQEIAGSDLGPDIGYCEMRGFPGYPQGKFRYDEVGTDF
jgi:hypothetical protein